MNREKNLKISTSKHGSTDWKENSHSQSVSEVLWTIYWQCCTFITLRGFRFQASTFKWQIITKATHLNMLTKVWTRNSISRYLRIWRPINCNQILRLKWWTTKANHNNRTFEQTVTLSELKKKTRTFAVRSPLKTTNRQWGSRQLKSIIFNLSFMFHHDNITSKNALCYSAHVLSPRKRQGAVWVVSCTSISSSCCCKMPVFFFPWFHFRW